MASPLLSLAILRVNWKAQGKDYLDTFLPLMANVIHSRGYGEIEVERLRRDFREEFGLDIPYHATVSVLNRAKKRGLLSQRFQKLYPVSDRVAEFDSTDVVREQTERYVTVVREFVQFAHDQYGLSLNTQDAENAVIEFLKEHDLDILFASNQTSFLADVRSRPQHKYVLYKFIQQAHLSQPQTFQYILDIVVGHSLASTLLYGQDQTFISSLKGVEVYLDTRLVFQVLGLEGPERRAQVSELLKILAEQGTRVQIFDHTGREVSQILDTCVEWIDRGDYDPNRASLALRYMKENNFSSADVEKIVVNLHSLLGKSKVTVVQHPNASAHVQYQIDEEKLYGQIVEEYSATRQAFGQAFDEEAKKETIRIDVDSIASVYRLRRERYGRTIKDCCVVFVTTNRTLAKVAGNFDKGEFGQDFRIPSAVTDIFLGTIVWLQAPAKAEQINEKRLLAECYAGVRPNAALLKKYVQEVARLKRGDQITDEEYYTLRTHRVAMNLLAEKTLGDPEAFTDRTPEEVLDEIKGEIRAEATRQYQEEVRRHQETCAQLERAELERDYLRESLEKRADKWAQAASFVVVLLVGSLFFGGVVVQLVPGIFEGFTPVRILLLAFTALLGALSVGTGFNIKGLRSQVTGYVKQRILLQWVEKAND